METGIVTSDLVSTCCAARDAAIAARAKAEEFYRLARNAMREAARFEFQAHGSQGFTLEDRSRKRGHDDDGPDSELKHYTQQLDCRAWLNLIELSGMTALMDKTAKQELNESMVKNHVPFTPENVWATFEALRADAGMTFRRGIAMSFSELDRRFKSHDGFKIGARIILTHVFDDWGSFHYGSKIAMSMGDIERVFAILDGKLAGEDGKLVNPRALEDAIRADRKRGMNRHQSTTETPYFRIHCFKNGNAHLWMLRDDLVEKVNLLLTEYYGEVLPDGAPRDTSPDDLRSKSGLPAKDLSYYPTPDVVVDLCLRQYTRDFNVKPGMRALEPSAGTGNMVRGLLKLGMAVDAVEIDPDRVEALVKLRTPKLRVYQQNFLNMNPNPVYDLVLMNPPFYGTHWMEHVLHAFDFLVPGGTLIAVLPVSAQIGTSKKHETFHAWVEQFLSINRYNGRDFNWAFSDLPAESFAASGTRINTVILELGKPRT